ncbi:hypothetical protein EYF80_024708 [Liparis tanakae]|uniref:Uncharacterized protein n=1 Tax=Liparis tanakae TaxID=230148 RepID=A0A4Z2HGU9_9TELE|nr:hypothetical protein EYF80_024708 [Liparis tanakae]
MVFGKLKLRLSVFISSVRSYKDVHWSRAMQESGPAAALCCVSSWRFEESSGSVIFGDKADVSMANVSKHPMEDTSGRLSAREAASRSPV